MNLHSATKVHCLIAGFLMGLNVCGILYNATRGEWLNTAICSLLLLAVTYGLFRNARPQSQAHA